MAINKKIAIPLVIILLAVAAGGSWFLWQKKLPVKATDQPATKAKQLYTCTMHPFIIRDKPGTCPICGMELIKKIDDAQQSGSSPAAQAGQADMPSHVSLSPSQRVLADVATMDAKMESLNKEINAVGIVQYDQSRQARVTAWAAGRIERLNVNSVGATVSKERPVAELYSPDLVASEQEYLLALKSRDQLKNASLPSISENGEGLVASARQRLMLFGIKQSQIAELERSGKPDTRIAIYSPFSGIVIEKMVQQGQYVAAGEVLFNIADLSNVWVEVEVYENELSNIHVGQQVEIRSQSFPEKAFTGRIAFIYPFLDPKTRTLKADMFVNAVIRVPFAPQIVVPVTALIDTGRRQVVWVESSPGMFEPRTVKVGQQSNDKVQILSGLNSGEKVAVSGAYLIDSESQLKGGGDEHAGHEDGR
jgi:Cu(I)/Ag(I) efflux system membrane fusion protein